MDRHGVGLEIHMVHSGCARGADQFNRCPTCSRPLSGKNRQPIDCDSVASADAVRTANNPPEEVVGKCIHLHHRYIWDKKTSGLLISSFTHSSVQLID